MQCSNHLFDSVSSGLKTADIFIAEMMIFKKSIIKCLMVKYAKQVS